MDCQKPGCESVSLKIVLTFRKNFLNFRSDPIAKQNIFTLSLYISKIYASVVLIYSKIVFLKKVGNSLLSLIYCVLLIHNAT